MTSSIAGLLRERVVVLDGAMGTGLMARGLEPGSPPELWNLERPDDVRAVHAAYAAAGSDVLQTNTFGSNPHALARHGVEVGMLVDINAAAVGIARDAARDSAGDAADPATGGATLPRLVAGNIGPSGALLAPLGEAEPSELENGFGRQAAALAEAGVDYLSVETMMDLQEALCALRGARSATDLPVTVCMTFDRKPRGFFTMMGDRPADCMRVLEDAGATAVGANCSFDSPTMAELCSELVEATSLPVIVKPNAGLPEAGSDRPTYGQDPRDFAHDCARMVRAGARAVGGCCGTDERFIAALKAELDEIGA